MCTPLLTSVDAIQGAPSATPTSDPWCPSRCTSSKAVTGPTRTAVVPGPTWAAIAWTMNRTLGRNLPIKINSKSNLNFCCYDHRICHKNIFVVKVTSFKAFLKSVLTIPIEQPRMLNSALGRFGNSVNVLQPRFFLLHILNSFIYTTYLWRDLNPWSLNRGVITGLHQTI